ncbi:VanZ family protein [Peribacillus faecalis]
MFMLFVIVVIKFTGNIHLVIDTIQSNKSRGSGINLVPFRTINSYIGNKNSVSFLNIFGNIIPFIPMGFILPMAFSSQRTLTKTMMTCFLIICGIEIFQYVSRLGSFDVDDIILNIFSCFIGFILFRTYQQLFNKAGSEHSL